MQPVTGAQSMSVADHKAKPIGTSAVKLLIPSRRKDGGIVDSELRGEWVARALKELDTNPFGGSTPTPVIGSYVHDDGWKRSPKSAAL